MIGWMAWSLVFALLLGLAARSAEELVCAVRRPVRGVWLGALALSALVPALVWGTGTAWPGVLAWSGSAEARLVDLLPLSGHPPPIPSGAGLTPGANPDARLLFAVWLLMSAGALFWFGAALWRVMRARSTWRAGELQDRPVLFSAALGPALVGLRQPAIVVPAWVQAETAAVQRMILLHEEEHARSGDHLLLALVPLLLIALPWNLPLWWQARRLRLAIELDCDARVLRRGVAAREYGTLLLDLAGQNQPQLVAAASLAEPRTFLERRILAMSARTPRLRPVRVLTAAAATTLLAFAACESTTPMAPKSPEPRQAQRATEGPSAAAALQDAGDTPLYIVDGVRLGRMANPSTILERYGAADIDRIEVIKGQAAIDRFGADAAHGAIVITTGRIRPGEPLPAAKAAAALPPAAPKTVAPAAVPKPGSPGAGPPSKAAPAAATVKQKPAAAGADVGVVKPGAAVPATAKPTAMPPGTPPSVKKAPAAAPAAPPGLQPPVIREGRVIDMGTPAPGEPLPLLVLDGAVTEAAALRRLDPDDIEAIQVIKGEAALSLYGARARDGVIIVTTRRR